MFLKNPNTPLLLFCSFLFVSFDFVYSADFNSKSNKEESTKTNPLKNPKQKKPFRLFLTKPVKSIENTFKTQPKDISNQINEFLDEKSKTNFGVVNKNVNKNNKETLKMLKNYYDALAFKKISIYNKFISKLSETPLSLYNFNNLKESRRNIHDILSTNKGREFLIKKSKDPKQNQKLWMIAIENYDIDLLNELKSLEIKMELSKDHLNQIIHSLKSHQYEEIRAFLNNYIQQKDILSNDIQTNSIKLLKEVKMELSNNELVKIIKSFRSFNYFTMIEYLFGFIKFNEHIAYDLINFILSFLTSPTTKEQQKIQIVIIKKLVEYSSAKNQLKHNFYVVIYSLNIQLLDFVIKELNLDVIELFGGINVLRVVVVYLIYNQNNIEFAYEMFDHLLSIGVNIYKRDSYGIIIYDYINQITDFTIKQTLLSKLSDHKRSYYQLTKVLKEKRSKRNKGVLGFFK